MVDTFRLEIPKEIVQNPFEVEKVAELKMVDSLVLPQKNKRAKQYVFLLLLNFLFIGVFLLNVYRSSINKLLKVAFNINTLKQYAQTESTHRHSYLLAYILLFFLFLVLMVYTIDYKLKLNFPVLEIAFVLIGFLLFNMFVNAATGFLLKKALLREMVFFNNMLFVLMSFPILILFILGMLSFTYFISHIWLYFILVVLGGLYFVKEIRNIQILHQNKIKLFSSYFFLYLCTFKMLPFVVFLKIIVTKIV